MKMKYALGFIVTTLSCFSVAVAQSSDVEINKKLLCRVTSTSSVLVKNGTALSESDAQKEVKKLSKKVRKTKLGFQAAKSSGDKKKTARAKKKFKKAKTARNDARDCVNGDLAAPTPTPEMTPTPSPTTPPFNIEARGGSFSGTWNNTTFASSGATTVDLTINDGVGFTLILDLGGNVFGGSDPEPETFEGTFRGTAPYTFTYNSTIFGENTTLTIDANGDFQFDAPKPVTGITDYTLSIDFDDANQTATGAFSLTLMSMNVVGTVSLTKDP
jgi:hypothetical protein